MSRQISPTAIGGFIIGVVGLAVAVLLFFGGQNFLGHSEKFELIYRSSIQGLRVGAPVTIKGTKIGEVIDINVKMEKGDKLDVYNSVIVSIQPDILYQADSADAKRQREMLLEDLLDRGLAAQLKTQSFLTGLLYIDVDFFDESNPPHYENVETEYKQLPTVATDLQEISKSLQEIDFMGMAADLTRILDGLDTMVNNSDTQNLTHTFTETSAALSEMAEKAASEFTLLRQSIEPAANGTNELMAKLNADMPRIVDNLDKGVKALEATMEHLNQTAAQANFILSDDSPTLHALTSAAESLQRAADTMNATSQLIERQPESLIWGKREP